MPLREKCWLDFKAFLIIVRKIVPSSYNLIPEDWPVAGHIVKATGRHMVDLCLKARMVVSATMKPFMPFCSILFSWYFSHHVYISMYYAKLSAHSCEALEIIMRL